MMALVPAEFSPMALVISERSTSSGMMACLAGSMNANRTPWMVEATRMWYQVTVSVMTDMARARAMRASAPWKSWISRLRSIRSAIAPPNGARASIGKPYPMLITPNSPAEPVSSYARYPWPRDWNWPAHHMNIVPVQRYRKLRLRRAAKVLRSPVALGGGAVVPAFGAACPPPELRDWEEPASGIACPGPGTLVMGEAYTPALQPASSNRSFQRMHGRNHTFALNGTHVPTFVGLDNSVRLSTIFLRRQPSRSACGFEARRIVPYGRKMPPRR